MNLKDIGEFGFIESFATKFDHLIKEGDSGIGDDCAVLSINDTTNHVISTDLLIEDIHFLKDKISAKELGYKSLAVNLSDIAAMGAQPLYSFLSLGIPKDTPVEFLDGFMEGFYQLSEKYNTPLMGGDTTKSVDKLVINVAVVGSVEKSKMHLRSMAQTGDMICVSGFLGDSGGGLKALLEPNEVDNDLQKLVNRHHQPEPQILEGLFLGKSEHVHAMMDVSDGVSSDLKHILKASNKSARIEVEKLPASPLLTQVSQKQQWNLTELCASGGEDYELLFTVKPEEFVALNQRFLAKFGKPLYAIGKIEEGPAEIHWLKDGQAIMLDKLGFNHFGG